MVLIKKFFIKLLSIYKIIKSLGTYIKKDISLQVVKYGNEYTSWSFYPDLINEQSIVYSFGVGDDVSFDLGLINNFDVRIYAFDPTPKSIDWVSTQNLPKQFVLYPVGLADFNGKVKFHPPVNPDHISATILPRHETLDQSYKVEVKCLKSIMQELGHEQINLLKMDIEGAEYQVIDDMQSNNIKPDQLLIEFHHRFKNVKGKMTVNAINQLKRMGYQIFNISNYGDKISFIRADVITHQTIELS